MGSTGSVAVADSDPNVIFLGTGSDDVRSNVSTGRGVYKSTDGGQSWSFAGLYAAGQIGAVRIHPTNPDIVWVSAQDIDYNGNRSYDDVLGAATGRVDVFDYDRDAGLSGRRPSVRIPDRGRTTGRPDRRLGGRGLGGAERRAGGATGTRLEGHARRGGRAARTAGHRLHSSGDPRLDELFITTSREGLEPGNGSARGLVVPSGRRGCRT